MATQIQLRRGTAATWTSDNPVLAQGEPALETDTGLRKIGDGATAWTSLPYLPSGTYSKPGGGIPATDLTTGVQTALTAATGAVPTTAKGAASGVASLDGGGQVPVGQLGNVPLPTSPDSSIVVTGPTSAPELSAAVAIAAGVATAAPKATVYPALSTLAASGRLAVQGLYSRTQPMPIRNGTPTTFRPMAVDPNTTGVNGTGRLWGTEKQHGWLSFSDDDGATITPVVANPSTDTPASGFVGVEFVTDSSSSKWVFALTGTSLSSPCSGEVFRSPAPAAAGTGIVFTKVWGANGLALGPGGAATTAPANATLRNSSFAVDAATGHAFVGVYGNPIIAVTSPSLADGIMRAGSNKLASAGTPFACSQIGTVVSVAGAGAAGAALSTKIIAIDPNVSNIAIMSTIAHTDVTAAAVTFSATAANNAVNGGPVVYHTANVFATSPIWTQVVQLPYARHIHAVKIIGGVPWVSCGDQNGTAGGYQQYPGIGIWTASSLATPTTWSQRTLLGMTGTDSGGFDPINMIPITVNGVPMVICESDADNSNGPLMFTSQVGTANRSLNPTCKLPLPYTQTMRSLTVTPQGNVIWAGITEAGVHGNTDCVWFAAAPSFDTAILLEDTGSPTLLSNEILCDAVVSNGYFWLGTYRCVLEKLVGQ